MSDNTAASTKTGSVTMGGAPVSTGCSTLRACTLHSASGFDMWCGACAILNGYVPSTQTPIPAQCELVDKTALDALREAVKGCGENYIEELGCYGLRTLCSACQDKRDAAVARLLGSEIEGDSNGR